VRIVGGEFRGRSLAVPKSNDIRPTADRTRESLFNILSHAYPECVDGTRILDLFAGTGAVGLEAVSRGCRHALFVENSVEGRGLLWENIDALGLHGKTRILRRDATDLGSVGNLEPFQFLFADPPYGKGLGEKAMAAAAKGGWLQFRRDCGARGAVRRCRFGRSFLSVPGEAGFSAIPGFISSAISLVGSGLSGA
jgi:16S rRNA (guanine966-N2)-methyltransferase